MTLNITLEFPDALFQELDAAGLLNQERITALLLTELSREAAWQGFSEAAASVREAAHPEYGALSEAEVMRIVNEEIHLMRAEKHLDTPPYED
jgi:hypothetical protein